MKQSYFRMLLLYWFARAAQCFKRSSRLKLTVNLDKTKTFFFNVCGERREGGGGVEKTVFLKYMNT